MISIREYLQNLGIEISAPVPPVGAYVPALAANGLVYVSGQLPLRNGEMVYKGRLGEDMTVEEGKKAAELCFINALAAVAGLHIPFDHIRRVVRLVGHIRCTADFVEQHLVLNGASEMAHMVFGEKGVHSRAVFGAYALPLGAAMELEAIFALQ